MRSPVRASTAIAELENLCRAKGLPLTVQRRAVLKTLIAHQGHPTADQVFDQVGRQLQNVSRTTVYRVLETLVTFGLARKVSHPGAAARFEAEMRRHHHLICQRCGKVVDLEDPRLDAIPFPSRRARGFQFVDYSVHFLGTCSSCTKSKERRD